MVKSMTGYGRAEQSLNGRTITVELRSVNNRYLDCSIRIPRLYLFAEDGLKSQVQSSISRGKVDVFVTMDSAGADRREGLRQSAGGRRLLRRPAGVGRRAMGCPMTSPSPCSPDFPMCCWWRRKRRMRSRSPRTSVPSWNRRCPTLTGCAAGRARS